MMPKTPVSMPIVWLKKIDRIVKDDTNPFQTRGEVIRHAIASYLKDTQG